MSTKLLKSIIFATKKHNGQPRSGTDMPYLIHLLETAELLSKIPEISGGGDDLVISGILHDILEDTETTFEELIEEFGSPVAKTVLEVTDDPSLTKKEQRNSIASKVAFLSKEAQLVKLADGISNVRATNKQAPERWGRSLKLAFCKTVENIFKLLDDCEELDQIFIKEMQSARNRLTKSNYYTREEE